MATIGQGQPINEAHDVNFGNSDGVSWQKEAMFAEHSKIKFGKADNSPDIQIEHTDGSFLHWEIDRQGIGGAGGLGNYVSSTNANNNSCRRFANLEVDVTTIQGSLQSKVNYIFNSPPVNKIMLTFTTNMTPYQDYYFDLDNNSEILRWRRGDTVYRQERLVLTDAGTTNALAYYGVPELVNDVGGIQTYEVTLHIEQSVVSSLVYPIVIDPTTTQIVATDLDFTQSKPMGQACFTGTHYLSVALYSGVFKVYKTTDLTVSGSDVTGSPPFTSAYFVQVVPFSDGTAGVFAIQFSSNTLEYATFDPATDTWGSKLSLYGGGGDPVIANIMACVDDDDTAWCIWQDGVTDSGIRIVSVVGATMAQQNIVGAAAGKSRALRWWSLSVGDDKLHIYNVQSADNKLYHTPYTISTDTVGSSTKTGDTAFGGNITSRNNLGSLVDENGNLFISIYDSLLSNIGGSWASKYSYPSSRFYAALALTDAGEVVAFETDSANEQISVYNIAGDSGAEYVVFDANNKCFGCQQVPPVNQRRGESLWCITTDDSQPDTSWFQDTNYTLLASGNGYFNRVLRTSLTVPLRQTIR